MSERSNKTLVSLGISCQTTHQLRRLVNSQQNTITGSTKRIAPSGPFDWLICPAASTINLLDARIPDFTKEHIHIKKGRAYWADFNIYFWHGFLVTGQQDRRVNIKQTFDRELARWRYLRDRFRATDPMQTVFVLSNTQNNLATEVFTESELDQYHFTATILDDLCRSLANYFHTTPDNIQLLILTRKELSSGFNDSKAVHFLPLDHNEWKGSNQSWDQWWQQKIHSVLPDRKD